MKRLWTLALGALAAISMILRPGSGDVQISQGQSWPCMHFVRIECDSVDPVEKLTHGSCQLFAKVDFGLPRADFLSRVDLDLEASRSFRPTPQTKIWCNFVQSYFVRILAYGTWLRSRVNAPCLAWSRFGRVYYLCLCNLCLILYLSIQIV